MKTQEIDLKRVEKNGQDSSKNNKSLFLSNAVVSVKLLLESDSPA